ncbi:MAG: hypothetical protein KDD67_09580 [Ignavibacteriae bacterium]|nr:hypothetical protein [Ignavibacteriota bacterium]
MTILDTRIIDRPVEELTTELRHYILRTLLYYDLFDYPLTGREICLFLESGDFGLDVIEEELEILAEEKIIQSSNGYWFLGDQNSQIVEKRLRMEEEGNRMWVIARRFARLMRITPFVRGVFISGQLSRYIADQKSDIDYFIVTEPGRLWIVRTLFVLFRRTILFNNRKYFCTNYYITTDNLEIQERNIYAACETASLKPIWNQTLFNRFAQENQKWVREFYPDFDYRLVEKRKGISESRSLFQRAVEALLPKSLVRRLDAYLLKSTKQFWRTKFPNQSENFYQTALRCTPNESRAHPDDLSTEVLRRYEASLKRHGIRTTND